MSSIANAAAPKSTGNTLVIVDDEESICKALTRLLGRDGYEIFATTRVDEALRLIEQQPIDVVISDQRMPICRGTDFLASVRNLRPESVRIILSGYSDVTDVAHAMSAGAINKFLTKPWDDGLLRADIREAFARARSMRELTRGVLCDEPTGLPTSEYLESVYGNLQEEARSKGTILCAFYIAMEQLGEIRAGYGTDAADTILKRTADRLEHTFGREVHLARHGEGFVMLSDALAPAERLAIVRERLSAIEAGRVRVSEDLTLRPSFGVGCAFDGENQKELKTLIEHAQAAVRSACSTINARARLFDPEMQAVPRPEIRLEAELREALELGRLLPYFQPQIDLLSGHVSGVEALVRWPHSEQGFLSPAEFIPIAERSGLIVPIGEFMLDASLAAFARWKGRGFGLTDISVNVSAVQLGVPSFVHVVAKLLERHSVDSRALVLEITESVAVAPGEAAKKSIAGLGELGVKLAIDDFGTGHSNPRNLIGLHADKVKLDRSLVPIDETDLKGRKLLTSVAATVADLGCEIIAEGVETAEQLAMAHAAGCRYIQGYFYSPPVREQRIDVILDAGMTTTH